MAFGNGCGGNFAFAICHWPVHEEHTFVAAVTAARNLEFIYTIIGKLNQYKTLLAAHKQ